MYVRLSLLRLISLDLPQVYVVFIFWLILLLSLPAVVADWLSHPVLTLLVAVLALLVVGHHLQHFLQPVGRHTILVDDYVFLYDLYFLFYPNLVVALVAEQNMVCTQHIHHSLHRLPVSLLYLIWIKNKPRKV